MNDHTDQHGSAVSFDFLKKKQRAIRNGFPEHVGLRIHRSISWVGRAEKEIDDFDARFLFYWIAFNAAYANERDATAEREAFAWFFSKVCELDQGHRLYDAVWTKFTGSIRLFLENKFVFSPFWSHQNGVEGYEDWQERFDGSKRVFHLALARRDTVRILSLLFDRLYVLRNQMIHGGSTWNSNVNRSQLQDGSEILSCLVPLMLDVMMDNPFDDWGYPLYPVVEE